MELLIIAGVDISHVRLIDLTRLADQAKPFYDWVETQFQVSIGQNLTLDQLLLTSTPDEIRQAISNCYAAGNRNDLPILFDGVGRSYPHNKACYYFFTWLIRDAPQQRLGPLIQRIIRNSGRPRIQIEIDVITALISKYRSNVKTFSWDAIREIIIDRLEGSRRSIKGHEKETVVRTAILVALQTYYDSNKNYGVFDGIEIPNGQISIGGETYDVSVNLLDRQGLVARRILIPIKTRETEGGGHSHLFTRDILSAINAVRSVSNQDYLIVVIVARNWARRETINLSEIVDHLVLFDISPSEFSIFEAEVQEKLNSFMSSVLDGIILPKGS